MAFNEARDAVVQVASESTPGTAETSGFSTVEINGTDAAGVLSPDIAFTQATILRPDFDQRPGTPGRAKSTLNIPSYATVGAAASGGPSAPVNGILLKAAGLAETVGAEVVSYEPTATDQSMTVESYTDGIKTVASGVRGGCSLSFPASQYPTLTFTGEGAYGAPTSASVPAGSYPNEVLHDIEGGQVTINGITDLVVRSFDFQWAVTQAERLDINSDFAYAGTAVTAKQGTMSAVVEFLEGVSSWNPEALLLAGNTMAVSIEVGDFDGVAHTGSSVGVSASAAQLTSVTRSADSGVMVANLTWQLTGATPFTINFKSADTDL